MKYSYTIVDDRANEIAHDFISEEKYNEVLENKEIKLIDEWSTEYNDKTLYGKRFKNKVGYTLFLWKEVTK